MGAGAALSNQGGGGGPSLLVSAPAQKPPFFSPTPRPPPNGPPAPLHQTHHRSTPQNPFFSGPSSPWTSPIPVPNDAVARIQDELSKQSANSPAQWEMETDDPHPRQPP